MINIHICPSVTNQRFITSTTQRTNLTFHSNKTYLPTYYSKPRPNKVADSSLISTQSRGELIPWAILVQEMWPSLSRNPTRHSLISPRRFDMFALVLSEESVYSYRERLLPPYWRHTLDSRSPLAARNAARNHSISGGAAFLHEFPIVLFLRSPVVHLYHASVPCKLFVERSGTARYEGQAELAPWRDPRSRVLHRAGSLSVSDMSKECTHVCERWFAYEWALPTTRAPPIHQARGSSLIEERATVMWNMITHEQIIRVITIALAGQQPARRLQGIWFYLWTHGSWCTCRLLFR